MATSQRLTSCRPGDALNSGDGSFHEIARVPSGENDSWDTRLPLVSSAAISLPRVVDQRLTASPGPRVAATSPLWLKAMIDRGAWKAGPRG